MPRRTELVCLIVAGSLLTGCATARDGSLPSRFVRQGEPAVDVGGPPIGAWNKSPAAATPPSAPATVPAERTSISGLTIEASDRRLLDALTSEAVLATPERRLRVAREYERLGIFDAAYARAERAIAQDPRCAEAHEMEARLWRKWGMPSLGLPAAYRAISFAPASASAQNTLGTVLDQLGYRESASAAYQRAWALDRSASWALNNLCYSAFRTGHLSEARSWCEEALKIAPRSAATHNNLALTFAASGDLAGARREFLLAGDAAAADFNLGIVYLAGREYASAADRFERAIKARPNFDAAKVRAHDARMRALAGGQ